MSALNLTKADVYERLKALLIADFGIRDDQIGPSTKLVDDLDLDSVDWVDMAVALEVETGQELEEEDLASIRTVQDVVDVIYGKLQPSENENR